MATVAGSGQCDCWVRRHLQLVHQLTENESEHVRQCPRSVEDDMELARLKDEVPYCGGPSESPPDTNRKVNQCTCIRQSENRASWSECQEMLGLNDVEMLTQHLLVDVRIQPQDRLRESRQDDRPEKRPRHGSREGKVIIVEPEPV